MTTLAPIPMMKFFKYLKELDLINLYMLVEMFFKLKDKMIELSGIAGKINHTLHYPGFVFVNFSV